MADLFRSFAEPVFRLLFMARLQITKSGPYHNVASGPCTPHFGGQFDAAGWQMNENMVDHFTSDRGLAVGAEPRWMLGIIADLMCRKSLKNNDLPPPPHKIFSSTTH